VAWCFTPGSAVAARFRFSDNVTVSGDDADNGDPGRRVGEPIRP
jgi:hypothetical protein